MDPFISPVSSMPLASCFLKKALAGNNHQPIQTP
jgi:hypothetical protein